jgi:hypothetical protein
MQKLIPLFIGILLLGCSKNGADTGASTGGSGKGGSLARFAVANNRLYVVEDRQIKVFNYANPLQVIQTGTVNITMNTQMETAFIFKNLLYVGARDGMFIYNLNNPDNPMLEGTATHLRSCDPVVANDTVSYVTLRGGTTCGTASPGLYTYNVKNIKAPIQTNYTALPTPWGLGLNDKTLYVCLADSGLQVVNIGSAYQPQMINRIKTDIFYDVIVYQNHLLAFVKNGIGIYDISNANNPVKLGFVAN